MDILAEEGGLEYIPRSIYKAVPKRDDQASDHCIDSAAQFFGAVGIFAVLNFPRASYLSGELGGQGEFACLS